MLLAMGACTEDPPVEPPADSDREALEAAREAEAAALAAMEGWEARTDASAVAPTEARTVVIAHVTALDDALSATPAPSPTGSESLERVPAPSTEQVVALLDDAAGQHTRALRTSSPEISPLLASIAASDAALAAAIRRSD